MCFNKSIFLRPIIGLAFLLCVNLVSAQKSAKNQSVGENLDEISTFLNRAGNSMEKVSDSFIEDMETLCNNNKTNKVIEQVKDWGESSILEINDAALEAKLWLKKQHFTAIKKSNKKIDDINSEK